MSRKIIISEYIEEILPEVTDEEAGWILRAVVAMNRGEAPGEPPPGLRIAWRGIQRQQEALVEGYAKTCAARRDAANARWHPPTESQMQMHAFASNFMQMHTKEKEREKEEERERDIPRIPKPNPKPDAGAREDAAAEPPPDLGPPPPAPAEGDAMSAFSASVSDSVDTSSNFFVMPEGNLIAAALKLVGEESSAFMRNVLRRRMRQMGVAEFRDVLGTYEAELRAGEHPDNLGRCLNAKLSARAATCALAVAVSPPPASPPPPLPRSRIQ